MIEKMVNKLKYVFGLKRPSPLEGNIYILKIRKHVDIYNIILTKLIQHLFVHIHKYLLVL